MALFQNISIDQLLKTWAADGGPTEDEKNQYADAASELLKDDDMVAQFTANVEKVGTWANEVDASFDKVNRTFTDMVNKYGGSFPGLSNFKNDWNGYTNRWVDHLSLSRDVASEHVAILKRFDQVYLDMVEMIVTEQDRKDVILELQVFIDEKHDKSQQMSEGFLKLKRDVETFIPKFNEFIADTGTELAAEAKKLQAEIDSLWSQIRVLDQQIKDATDALAACASCLCLLGVIVAGSVLAAYQAERDDKMSQLSGKEKELAIVNEKQQALAYLQTQSDGVKPEINLICEKLVLFAEIWSSVRSQAVQFRDFLQASTNSPTNLGFKKQVRLARDVCVPLEAGLEKYATKLENRQKQKAGQN